MKWATAILYLGLVASNVLAAPPPATEIGPGPYKMKIISKDTGLNGRFLSNNDGNIGFYGADALPVEALRVSAGEPSWVQMHIYPTGIIDHVFALYGSDGLFTLIDLPNPEKFTPDNGDTVYWKIFQIAGDMKLTNDAKGKWLAFPDKNGWSVKWTDGSAVLTQDYLPIEIVLDGKSR